MKTKNIAFFLILLNFHAYSQFDFRNTSWGMTKEQVKNAENTQFIHEEDQMLLTFGRAANIECYILYFFIHDSLVETEYFFKAKHENKNDYIGDYDLINEAIKKKYGKQTDVRQIWKNNEKKDDKNLFGEAVAEGSLTLYSKWKTDKTEITAILSGMKNFGQIPELYEIIHRNEMNQLIIADNKNDIYHVIYYSSIRYKYLKDNLEKEKTKGKLQMEF